MAGKKTTGKLFIDFLCQLHPLFPLPADISILHPYQDKDVRKILATFYNTYYNDTHPRILILGINPGRLGAGITGIPFTDPAHLTNPLRIAHHFAPKKELSGAFIYEMIEAYGGPQKFFRHFLLSSLCPLGFIKGGKNLNYYDLKILQEAATPFIRESIEKQKALMQRLPVCLCLGEGKNYRYFRALNEVHQWFSHILPLPHPRFVMQYRRKEKKNYIALYLEKLGEARQLSGHRFGV